MNALMANRFVSSVRFANSFSWSKFAIANFIILFALHFQMHENFFAEIYISKFEQRIIGKFLFKFT